MTSQPIQPWEWVAAVEADLPLARLGATAVFLGRMRDSHAGRAVREMWLEHYPGMTERCLRTVADEIAAAHPVGALAVVHRVGCVQPTDTLVVVAAWSGHRKAAQDAARALLERVKSDVPLWKRETLADGTTEWVVRNTDGRESDA
ncbi:MAG: molybdenum cofactor biosynthesis protein MoaE [Thioalkalivibrionaceae bacterium]